MRRQPQVQSVTEHLAEGTLQSVDVFLWSGLYELAQM
jgi:hypothetical protein